MSLALRLGFPSRTALLRALTGVQIDEWLVFFQIEREHHRQLRDQAELEARARSGLDHLKRGA